MRGLRRPALTVLFALVLLTLAGIQIGRLDNQFFPLAERDQLTVDIWLPEGRDIVATLATAKKVEAIVAEQKGVRSFVAYIGGGGPRFYYNVSPEASTPNYAQILLNTENIAATKQIAHSVQEAVNREIAEARVTVRILEQGPPVGAPVALRVQGDDIRTLRNAGDSIKAILAVTPGAVGIDDSFGVAPLSLKVDVDDDRAALFGWNSAIVAQAIQMAYSGQTATFLREGDREIPVNLRLIPGDRAEPSGVLDLYLPANGGSAPLRQAATIRLAAQEGRIMRRNGVRTLVVSAFSDGTRLPSAILKDVQAKVASLRVPEGVTIGYGGEAAEVNSSFGELLLIFGLSLVANLVIVVAQFNSLRVALAVLAAVPLGVTGAVLGLTLAHQPFGFMAFLGIISLGGVVTNHAIVLFEYAMHEKEKGLSLADALVQAGRLRFRPILLTVLLSIGGLIPQAVNGGNLWPPMAWSLIAGLLCSLALTLVVVPSFYALISGGGRRETVTAAESVKNPFAAPAVAD